MTAPMEYLTAGTRSMFGDQLESHRATAPSTAFSANPQARFIDTYSRQKLNTASPGFTHNYESSIGRQSQSYKKTQPSWTVGARDHLASGAMIGGPGPGQYSSCRSSIGPQIVSNARTSTAVGNRTGNRWSSYRNEYYEIPATPGPGDPVSYIGTGGPKYSMGGTAPRYDFGVGGTNKRSPPSYMDDPAPGSYSSTVSFGPQLLATKSTSPTTKFPSTTRSAAARVYISKDHERAILGSASPGPSKYRAYSSIGSQSVSPRKTSPSFGFGSGGRFSDYQPTKARTTQRSLKDDLGASAVMPGPGAYRV
ncbi:unnamed protein product [Pedinophyceae sp. YPF-701]|nr:unnamed protein product [Pedinophyceae sp. YPF-701]